MTNSDEHRALCPLCVRQLFAAFISVDEKNRATKSCANVRDTGKVLLHCQWMQVGEVSLEAPDLVVIRVRGSITPDEVEKVALLLKQAGGNGTAHILTLMETATFEGSPEARRHFIETIRGLSTVVDAVVGANFRFRVLLRIVENVARIMSNLTLRISFLDDEASARVWLRDQGCVACGAAAPST